MKLFSIKLRASLDGQHVSGAERIVPEESIQKTVNILTERIKDKKFDQMIIKINRIKKTPIYIKKTLKIIDLRFTDFKKANEKAVLILHQHTKIPENRLKELIRYIHTGASPDRNNMRGAMIVNQKGERIELDSFRGVRTTEVDFEDREAVEKILIKKGFTKRTADALALTTKNLFHPDIIAEYCISDEKDYLTGYVSTKDFYYRLTPLKEKGNPKGGRIYFVKNSTDIKELYRYLQETPVLIKDVSVD